MIDLDFDPAKPFLVLGRAGLDIYPTPVNTKTAEVVEFVSALGGSSANIAVALCQLGQKASLVTCVSDDAVGRYVENQLRRYGVDSQLVRRVSGDFRTSLAVVESTVVDHQSVIYRNNAADFQMHESDIDTLTMSDFAALVVTGTCLTKNPSRHAVVRALGRARDAGLTTVIDLDYRPYSWETADHARQVYNEAVALVDIVIGNDEEFGHMAGNFDAGSEFAKSLAAAGRLVVYKMGERGSQAYFSQDVIVTGVFPVTPIKPTGAGDAFLGSFLASLSRQEGLAKSIMYGSASAALVVTRVGCAPAMPTLEELSLFVDRHQESVEQRLGRL